ncbi:LacI family DNA-binding transcriptional regulator [Actinomadura alba]|uniref:LacI family DNA-binding transcriptional regulator n=1 Tax=Actinomadura alba TaxID=406431 RepID=A0ABR7LVB5_9ACTN|nr:LacI family DNA-binding transcriptional regulator [Actinomadura alba]MBC6468787.1 LacI family DNA-binding transcriptional regulator [Actinomadura alba]
MTEAEATDGPVTIYTVAERAGVSIATVSRVLQGSARSSPLTRQKVLRAVEELDYVPLRAARTVDVKRYEAHGLVLPGLQGPYFAELLAGYESTAAQYGQSVVVVLSGGLADLNTILRTLLARVDGLVLAGGTASDTMVRTLARSTPTVMLARAPIEGCHMVAVENRESVATLTTHLLGHGRRRLVFAGDPETSHDIHERYAGFADALVQAGLREALPPIDVWFEEPSAPEIVKRLLAARSEVDAVVCANDELALATMSLLGRAGVRVPDDLAIVGFDDIMASRYVEPGLTTVKQPTHSLGRWAAIRLHERIQGPTRDVQPQILPTQVVLRGSCGCPWDGSICD